MAQRSGLGSLSPRTPHYFPGYPCDCVATCRKTSPPLEQATGPSQLGPQSGCTHVSQLPDVSTWRDGNGKGAGGVGGRRQGDSARRPGALGKAGQTERGRVPLEQAWVIMHWSRFSHPTRDGFATLAAAGTRQLSAEHHTTHAPARHFCTGEYAVVRGRRRSDVVL